MAIDKLLETDLLKNNVYDAWQFVVNTVKIINTAQYCKDVIADLIAGMSKEHDDWKNSLFSELFNQEGSVKSVSITTDNLPAYQLKISNIDTTAPFLLDKLTKDFFQYARNAFDCMSQIANAALLANKAKKVDSVDFPKILNVFNQQTYSQNFPYINNWYNNISASPEFAYIDAFNNRTKHTFDIYLKVSMDMFGNNNLSEINPFFRKDVQHDKTDIVTYLTDIFDFVTDSFDSFIEELKKEYPKQIYTENRIHKLNAHQQKMKQSPECDFSVVFIDSQDDIDKLSDEISVLLLHLFDDGEIYSKNCEIDTILIRKSKHEYIGKYVAEEPYGDDTLVKYRKYKKDPQTGQIVHIQAMMDWKKNPVFYKANPYMDFTTVSDDDEFLNRVQIPF